MLRAAVTSRGCGSGADAAVISAPRRARVRRRPPRAQSAPSLASSDSGDEGAGHRPPRKRSRRVSPPAPAEPAEPAMQQPATNGTTPAPAPAEPAAPHVNGDAVARNGDVQPPGPRMSDTDQEIVRLIGQHLLSVGLE